jgi:hypothetical protein
MNYLPELREAMVDAARRHHQIQDAPPAVVGRERRRRRFRGGRPLALIVVLCLAGGTGAATAAGLFESPAAVHAPSTPSAYAGAVAAGSVLALAARLGDRSGRSATDPRLNGFSRAGLTP